MAGAEVPAVISEGSVLAMLASLALRRFAYFKDILELPSRRRILRPASRSPNSRARTLLHSERMAPH
jgi:hypothetical protein